MFWADKIAKDIVQSGEYKPYHVDDMFTPSGYAHIGSLRGPLVHDMVYRTLRDSGVEVTFTYIFNDFDPIDGLSSEFLEKSRPYLGVPLRLAPSPVPGYESFADHFGKDFFKVLQTLGVGAKVLSSWEMYHSGKFNTVIKEALDGSEIIQDIYQRISGSKKREKGWLPLQVVCEKCGKLGTTRVHDWDGTTVAYTCEPEMVTWAKGCGYSGRTSPFADANPSHHPGKLPWKVDWPAHWKVLGITIEGAGKDHSSAGGSRDIAREICKEVFHYPEPFNLPYEFFLIGGKKMSSSKGLGLKARDLTGLLPPEVGRFLFTRTDYKQAIEIDPMNTMAIPDLFDEYDRCWQAYVEDGDENFARAFVLSQVDAVPKKEKVFLPRFRDIANYKQLPNVDLWKRLEEMKKGRLTEEEMKIFKEREKYVSIWLGEYAPVDQQVMMVESLPKEAEKLTKEQKIYLAKLIPLVTKGFGPDQLQFELYELAKKSDLQSVEAFSAIYLSFMGKERGPRAAWFLLQYPKEKVIKRLKEASGGNHD